MSKSKYNYKVYDGKVLKKFFENSKMYALVFLFIIGLIIGAASVSSDSTLLKNVSDISQSYIASRAEQGIGENCLNSLTVSMLFMLVNVFMGFSLIGYPLIIWLPLIKGLGIGALTGYLYSAFKITGLGYCVLTIYPGTVVAVVALILACNDSAEYSKNAFLKAVRGRGQFEKDETKIYLIRQFVFCVVSVASSIVDSLFAAAFSVFFKI